MKWLDGRLVGDGIEVPARAGVPQPFETMGARGGDLPLWPAHLERLQAAAARLQLPFRPDPGLRAAAQDLLLRNGHGDDVLRLQLVPTDGGVATLLETRDRGPVRTLLRLLPTVVRRPASAPPGDLKARPRTFYDAVLQEAQDGGADDGIVLAGDGEVLETALCNLWVLLQGRWTTPPLDGRVLPGIARARLLAQARAQGLRVAEQRLELADLHRAEALAVSNAVHGLRQAVLLGGKAVPADAFLQLTP